ncbi:MAG: family 78 glycoside hydrolase catalytic domain [Kiritimatiellae bacterium]|nr:family 78 glycoside hydrolase catalytic domain [Kiritimatiellia bacterium]
MKVNSAFVSMCLAAALVACGAAVGQDFSERVVRGESAAPASVATNAAGNVLVDFGRHVAGWIEVDVSAPGDYTFVWGEMVDASGSVQTNAFFTRQQGTLRCACTHGRFEGAGWTRVPYCAGNGGAFCPDAVGKFGTVMPFRWLEVVRAPFRITAKNVRQVPIHYPYDMSEESFSCDSPALVRVHDFCKHSIRATTYTGKFIDGDRERLPYEADSYITQLGTYAITSDDTLVRAMADYFATHTTWPTEWKQFFVRIVHDDWMHSGKTDVLLRHYDLMKNVKSWRSLRRADGLLVTPGATMTDSPDGGQFCDIVDWAMCYRDGFVFTEVNAVVNALHYRNLRELAEMARAVGKDGDAAMFEAEAAQTFDAYQRVLFDAAAGRYRDGAGTDHATVQGNAMALACGVVPPERVRSVAGYVASKGFTCSTYMAQFVLEALFSAGREGEAIRLMASDGPRSWLGMMAKGATITMEFWDLTMEEPGRVPDMNHAWSTAPLNMISRWVLGVTPLKPGFAEVAVRPHPGPLKRLSGTVPTPRGPVRLEMALEAGLWRISLDTPAPASFEFAGSRRRLAAGRHAVELPAGLRH